MYGIRIFGTFISARTSPFVNEAFRIPIITIRPPKWPSTSLFDDLFIWQTRDSVTGIQNKISKSL